MWWCAQDELTDRFRANLVVSGVPAYLEDRVDFLTVGDVSLKVGGNKPPEMSKARYGKIHHTGRG